MDVGCSTFDPVPLSRRQPQPAQPRPRHRAGAGRQRQPARGGRRRRGHRVRELQTGTGERLLDSSRASSAAPTLIWQLIGDQAAGADVSCCCGPPGDELKVNWLHPPISSAVTSQLAL